MAGVRGEGKPASLSPLPQQFYLAAMHSLKRVTAMWQRRGPYAAIFMLRPDLVYLDPLPVAQLLSETKGSREWLAVPPRLFKLFGSTTPCQ